MIIYSLDSVIFILAKDFIGIGIHALALWYIFNGFRATSAWKMSQAGQ